jgi:hypothetical protein
MIALRTKMKSSTFLSVTFIFIFKLISSLKISNVFLDRISLICNGYVAYVDKWADNNHKSCMIFILLISKECVKC